MELHYLILHFQLELMAIVGRATTDTLTNKTLTAPTINGVVGGTTTSQTITTLLKLSKTQLVG